MAMAPRRATSSLVSHDNQADVVMAAGLGFARAGDCTTAESFFREAIDLFRVNQNADGLETAQAWLKAVSSSAS